MSLGTLARPRMASALATPQHTHVVTRAAKRLDKHQQALHDQWGPKAKSTFKCPDALERLTERGDALPDQRCRRAQCLECRRADAKGLVRALGLAKPEQLLLVTGLTGVWALDRGESSDCGGHYSAGASRNSTGRTPSSATPEAPERICTPGSGAPRSPPRRSGQPPWPWAWGRSLASSPSPTTATWATRSRTPCTTRRASRPTSSATAGRCSTHAASGATREPARWASSSVRPSPWRAGPPPRRKPVRGRRQRRAVLRPPVHARFQRAGAHLRLRPTGPPGHARRADQPLVRQRHPPVGAGRSDQPPVVNRQDAAASWGAHGPWSGPTAPPARHAVADLRPTSPWSPTCASPSTQRASDEPSCSGATRRAWSPSSSQTAHASASRSPPCSSAAAGCRCGACTAACCRGVQTAE